MNSRWVVPRCSVRCAKDGRIHKRLLRPTRGQRGRHLTVPEAPGCVASYPESSNPSPRSCLWTIADWSVGLFTKQNTQVNCPFIYINGSREKIMWGLMWGLRIFRCDGGPAEGAIQSKWGNATDVGHGCRSNPTIGDNRIETWSMQ